MPEMHLKQSGFTYSACGPFTKNKERIKKFMQTRNKNYIYKNDLDAACFQPIMAYDRYKDLTKRIESDNVLKGKAFKIASNPKYYGYERGLDSMVYKSFDKKSKVVVLNLCQINNLQMNFISQISENLKDARSILFLKTIFGELTLLICN